MWIKGDAGKRTVTTKVGGWYSLEKLTRFRAAEVLQRKRGEWRKGRIPSPEDGESVVFTGGILRKRLILRANRDSVKKVPFEIQPTE